MRRTKRKSSSKYASRSTKPTGEAEAHQDPSTLLPTTKSRRKETPPPSADETTPSTVPLNLQSGAPEQMPDPNQPPVALPISHSAPIEGINSSNTDIYQVPSVHAKLGLNVSEANKSKIKNGQFVEFEHLLETKTSQTDEKTLVVVNGSIVTKEKQKTPISNIEKWTDAFIIYMSIYISAHPEKCQDLLKYMQSVRLGASRIKGLGWRDYDTQFRLKVAADPSKQWDAVDQELWLMFMTDSGTTHTNAVHQHNTTFNKCYNFNYKGSCDRNPCPYQHVCVKCSGPHPQFRCPQLSNPNFTVNQPFRPRFPGHQTRFSRPTYQARSNFQSPRYMGPRRFPYQN